MFKTFLKIVPQLESSALTTMENTLNSRFVRVARRFSEHLKRAVLGGGLAALGLSIVDKLVNPLRAVNENIDNIFSRAEGITEQAKQFGTTTGTLLKLQTISKASGVDTEELSHLLVKFQAAVTQAKANPGQPSAVGQFVGEKDTADAFFKFLQGLKAAGKLNQELATQEVFGERKVLSVSKFLSADLDAKLAAASGINTGKATANIANAEKVADIDRTKKAVIDAKEFQDSSGKLNNEIANARAEQTQREADLRERQLASFKSLENINSAADQVNEGLQRLLVLVTDLIAKMGSITNGMNTVKSWFTRHGGKKLGIGD